MDTRKGYLALVLHAHLPFVRHPEHDWYLEEDWLYEAITECYVPLITCLSRIAADRVPCRLTLSVSPTLAEMLGDSLLQDRFLRYLDLRIELSRKEVLRTRHQPQFLPLARMYLEQYRQARNLVAEQYRGNILRAFAALSQQGILELITCPATHPYMPFIVRREVKRAQLLVARACFRRHFGYLPRGLWLAECGYEVGLDSLLKEIGTEYTLLDSHGILLGNPPPRFGVFAPVIAPGGVCAFGRDMESSWQVWNAQGGYPGDFSYREFYRDLGHDADYDYVRPYLHPDGVRRNLGFKYFRITGQGNLGQRAPYDRKEALSRAAEHAGDFVRKKQHQITILERRLKRAPLIVAPYDAELFGHWWYEGPQFLEWFVRKAASDQSDFQLVTLGDYLDRHRTHQIQQPAASSWGAEGFHGVWLNRDTSWLYRHTHAAEDRMVELANQYVEAPDDLRRWLNQAGRELLLSQSSDWAFLISRRSSPLYAIKRFREHIARFNWIVGRIAQQDCDREQLDEIASRDSIFPDLDYRFFRS